MGGCSAIGCSNNSSKGFKMYRYPRNKDRRRLWLLNTRRANWDPGLHATICNEHFEKNQFEQNRADGRKLLKPNAIPTIFNLNSDKDNKKCQKPLQDQDHFSQENCEEMQYEQDCETERTLEGKTAIPMQIIVMNSPASKEPSKKSPSSLQAKDKLSEHYPNLLNRIKELEEKNKKLEDENKKLKEEMKNKDECLKYLSELLKFSSVKSENGEL